MTAKNLGMIQLPVDFFESGSQQGLLDRIICPVIYSYIIISIGDVQQFLRRQLQLFVIIFRYQQKLAVALLVSAGSLDSQLLGFSGMFPKQPQVVEKNKTRNWKNTDGCNLKCRYKQMVKRK